MLDENSDPRIIEQLRRYGGWIEAEAGHPLSAVGSAPAEPSPQRDAGERTGWPWRILGRPVRPRRVVALALAAAALLAVVGVVATLRPGGEQPTIYAADRDPEGPLFVLPAEDSGFVASGGIINSETAVTSRVTGRLWIGTPDESGTTFGDVIAVCVSPVAAECTSLPTPAATRSRIEVDDRFLGVAVGDDGTVVVSDQRDLLHIGVRGLGADPGELATLLTDVTIDDDGIPSLPVEAPRVVFGVERSAGEADRGSRYLTSFRVDGPGGDAVSVSTTTGTRTPDVSALMPAGVGVEQVSFRDEVIDGVQVTRFQVVVPDLGTTRGLSWRATPNRVISVGFGTATFDELTEVARSLVEASETEWRAALPDHSEFENSLPVDQD